MVPDQREDRGACRLGRGTTRRLTGRRPGAALCIGIVLLACAAVPLRAQASPARGAPESFIASPHLPLGHWAYPVLDYWISAGRIDGLSPFVRPYRRAEVARAIEGLERPDLSETEREWLERFEEELDAELGVLRGTDPEERLDAITTSLRAGATYRSQTHRDLLRPELEGPFAEDRLLEHAFVEADGRAGAIVGGLRVGRDGIYRHDAQFPNGRVVPEKNAPFLDELGVRVEEAYLELQTRYASLFFGRMYRNWGLPGQPGFLRSDYAYSEEELAYRFGVERIFLTGSLASYRDLRGDTTRYVSTHRLEVRPWDELVLAVTEAVVHGGPSRALDPALVNPLGIWHIAREDGQPPKNALGQVDLWWRPLSGVALYGSLLADATGRSSKNTTCCQMGGSVGVEVAGPGPGWLLRLQGSALQSVVYRTSVPWEEWSVRDVGLGWDKVDLYLGTAEAQWLVGDGLLLQPRVELQVKGEGDFRELRPPPEELADFPDILLGETETTFRPALAGMWRVQGRGAIELRWDLGVDFIEDLNHREGVDRAEFVGNVRLTARTPRWFLPLR